VLRVRERSLDARKPALQALRQHDFSRTDRAAAVAINAAGAALGMVAQAEADARGEPSAFTVPRGGAFFGGGGGGGGGGGSFASVDVPALPLGGLDTGGFSAYEAGGGSWGAEAPLLVRVGVPAGELLADARASGLRAATAEGRGRAARSVNRAISPSAVAGGPSVAASADANYYLDPSNRVAFARATSDLPEAAKAAVAALLAQGKRLTVADVHQRRPPALASGIAGGASVQQRESFFALSLRQSLVPVPPTQRAAWKGGCVAATSKGATTHAALDTFDSFAKRNAEAW